MCIRDRLARLRDPGRAGAGRRASERVEHVDLRGGDHRRRQVAEGQFAPEARENHGEVFARDRPVSADRMAFAGGRR